MNFNLFPLLLTCLTTVFSTCITVIKCTDGLVIGSDTQSSSGNFIGDRETNKIFRLNNNAVLCCVSGSSDFMSLFNRIHSDISLYETLYNQHFFVSDLATYCRRLIHLKYSSAHILLIGFDEESKYPRIYEIVSGGSLLELPYAVAGSASSSLYPLLTELLEEYKIRNDSEEKQVNPSIIKWINENSTDLCSDKFNISSFIAFNIVYKILKVARTLDPKTGGNFKLWLFRSSGQLQVVNSKDHLKTLLKDIRSV
jgi:20S proteasome alpha/beta subunit